VSADVGSFLAGLLEGEASFGIAKQPLNTNHRCTMTVNMREDDGPLLRWLASTTGLGRITRKKARSSSRAQIGWQVGAKADCERLRDLLTEYPLRGRSSLHYAIWSGAVTSWIDKGPAFTRRNRDWSAIAYFKGRLHEAKQYDAEIPCQKLQPDRFQGLSGDWAGFLAGFVTAEGHLGIHKNGGYLHPRFQIAVRADDLALLTELKRRVGDVGNIYWVERTGNRNPNPNVAWQVRDSAGLATLVEIFDRCPPRGRRGREYRVWRQAVSAYLSPGPRSEVRQRLQCLRPLLDLVRQGRAGST
jgi:LAGLIDADG endonuclease